MLFSAQPKYFDLVFTFSKVFFTRKKVFDRVLARIVKIMLFLPYSLCCEEARFFLFSQSFIRTQTNTHVSSSLYLRLQQTFKHSNCLPLGTYCGQSTGYGIVKHNLFFADWVGMLNSYSYNFFLGPEIISYLVVSFSFRSNYIGQNNRFFKCLQASRSVQSLNCRLQKNDKTLL